MRVLLVRRLIKSTHEAAALMICFIIHATASFTAF